MNSKRTGLARVVRPGAAFLAAYYVAAVFRFLVPGMCATSVALAEDAPARSGGCCVLATAPAPPQNGARIDVSFEQVRHCPFCTLVYTPVQTVLAPATPTPEAMFDATPFAAAARPVQQHPWSPQSRRGPPTPAVPG